MLMHSDVLTLRSLVKFRVRFRIHFYVSFFVQLTHAVLIIGV